MLELDFLVLQLTVRIQLKPYISQTILLATILIMGSDGDLYIGNFENIWTFFWYSDFQYCNKLFWWYGSLRINK
jgi:hypothetical protein